MVVVTDRKDLDGQLYETFAACRIPLRSKPVQATDRADLKKLLSEQVAGGIFFTTIQKFAPEKGHDTVEEINPRSTSSSSAMKPIAHSTGSRATSTRRERSIAMASPSTCTMRSPMRCTSA